MSTATSMADSAGPILLVLLLAMPLLGLVKELVYQRMRTRVNEFLPPDSRVPILGASKESQWLVTVSYDELHPNDFWSRFDQGLALIGASWFAVVSVACVAMLVLT